MADRLTPPGTGWPSSSEPPPTPGADAAGPSRARRLAPFAVGGALTLVGVLALNALLAGPPRLTQTQVDDAIASALAEVTAPPAFSQLVYQAVQPSLVHIQVDRVEDPRATVEEEGEPSGLGSGVVVTADGDILTSLHVVEHASAIELTFADGSKSPAEIVVEQPENDIAVIRALEPPALLIPATLGNPGAVQQGTEVYALGSPFGLYGSVSAGVVSGLDRTFTVEESGRELTGLFQIDAAVNPGNSGGALVDRDGRLIGIVTALLNPTREHVFIGIGLAVPIDVAGGAAGLPPY